MSQIKLKLYPGPGQPQGTILGPADDDPTGPVQIGEGGGTDYVCGNCENVLLRDVPQGMFRNLYCYCGACKRFSVV